MTLSLLKKLFSKKEGVWCVVANVRRETPYGENNENREGSKHFSPGTKVYCLPPIGGFGRENIEVIGRHRGTRRYCTMIIFTKYLESWRVKVIYSPTLLSLLRCYWDGSKKSKKEAEELVRIMLDR